MEMIVHYLIPRIIIAVVCISCYYFLVAKRWKKISAIKATLLVGGLLILTIIAVSIFR